MAGGSAGINVTAFSAFIEPDGEEVAPPCREPHPTTSRLITKLRKQDMIVRFIVWKKITSATSLFAHYKYTKKEF
jgi:hypothetical protein